MAAPAKSIPQDLPPPGGYDPIQWKRIKLKTVFGGNVIFYIQLKYYC